MYDTSVLENSADDLIQETFRPIWQELETEAWKFN